MLERDAVQQLHGQEGALFVFADLVDDADIRMVQRGGGARLAPKSLQSVRVAREFVGQEFQSDVPPQIEIFGLVNDAHAAAAQFAQNCVMREGLTDHGSSAIRIVMLGDGGARVNLPIEERQRELQRAG